LRARPGHRADDLERGVDVGQGEDVRRRGFRQIGSVRGRVLGGADGGSSGGGSSGGGSGSSGGSSSVGGGSGGRAPEHLADRRVPDADLALQQIPGQERHGRGDLAGRHPAEQPCDLLDLGVPCRGGRDRGRYRNDLAQQHTAILPDQELGHDLGATAPGGAARDRGDFGHAYGKNPP